MRFRGGGVGHKSTREATDFFKQDRDQMDIVTGVDSGAKVVAEPQADDDDEPENSTIVEEAIDEEEEDYGYAHEYSSDSEGEPDGPTGSDTESVHDLGAEDDGGVVDPLMDELGYADL
jgi:hypothetical protein